ncbi:hypothetical protein F5Y03DRAFT_405064 [Xylaria venustula]|nr:hypothetical protein F5Y03DRAFT_405064 [Xylaria venustula]
MSLARSVEILCGHDNVPGPILFGLSLLFIRGPDEYRGWDDDTIERIIDNPFSIQHLPKTFKAGLAFLSSQKIVRCTPLSRLFPLWQAIYGLEQEGHEHLNQVGVDGAQGRLTRGHLWAMTMDQSSRDPLWDILQFTLNLQCEDPRDRVYAVLAIVDWGPDIAQPIQPDYNGDVYDLVRVVLPWLWSTPGLELSEAQTAFDQGRKTVNALQLEVQSSPQLANANGLRRRVHTKLLTSETMASSPPSISVVGVVDFKCLAMKKLGMKCLLLPPKNEYEVESDRRKVKQRIHDLTGKAPGKFQVVFDKHDRMGALLPHTAQPGDWIIGDIEAALALIVREQTDGRFYVIGKGVVDLPFFHCLEEVGMKFLATFDVDDFIALCACGKSVLLFGNRIGEFSKTLQSGVCQAPGSSYAVRHIV